MSIAGNKSIFRTLVLAGKDDGTIQVINLSPVIENRGEFVQRGHLVDIRTNPMKLDIGTMRASFIEDRLTKTKKIKIYGIPNHGFVEDVFEIPLE